MESSPSPNPGDPVPPPGPPLPGPTAVLISRDLIFTTKIKSTAEDLGVRVVVGVDPAAAAQLIADWRPPVVFVDLAAGEAASPPTLARLVEGAGDGTAFVAFGSHVEAQALADARAAGCREVMPRSKFTVELLSLIRRYFDRG
ncbi:MAG: response regulator [Isosphaeraceae bacterium]